MKIDKITPQIAALYLGQKCDVKWLYTDTINDAFTTGDVWHDSKIHHAHINRLGNREIELTLHLRSLESITEEECRELVIAFTGEPFPDVNWTAKNWWLSIQKTSSFNLIASTGILLILLSKGFDLFGLIDAGLAKESMRPNEKAL